MNDTEEEEKIQTKQTHTRIRCSEIRATRAFVIQTTETKQQTEIPLAFIFCHYKFFLCVCGRFFSADARESAFFHLICTFSSAECVCILHVLAASVLAIFWFGCCARTGRKKATRSEVKCRKKATAAERHKIKTKNENTTAGKEANGTNGLVEHNTQHMHMNLLAIRRW